MDSDFVPTGWTRRSLRDLLEPGGLFDGPFGSNLKTSDYTDRGVRVIRLENIGNLRFIGGKETYISEEKYSGLTKHTVAEEDIIVGSFVDGAVRVCILPQLATKAIAKADCFCVRPRRDIVDRRFIAFQLGTDQSRDALLENIHGATRPRITTKQLRGMEILVAPLAEQRRIVAMIQDLLGRVNAVRERLARLPILGLGEGVETRLAGAAPRVDKISRAILAKAFRGELVPTEAELARDEGRDYETAEALLARIGHDSKSRIRDKKSIKRSTNGKRRKSTR